MPSRLRQERENLAVENNLERFRSEATKGKKNLPAGPGRKAESTSMDTTKQQA